MLARMGASRKTPAVRVTLAANMRRRREELELSQERLAELAGFHRTYINAVERCHRNPTLDVIDRIAKALKTSVAELLQEW